MSTRLVSSATRREFMAAVAAGLPIRAQRPDRGDSQARAQRILTLIQEHGEGMDASFYLGGAGGPWMTRHDRVLRPTASAIKTWFLVELFDAHKATLDRPLPGAAAILRDDAHPAISHFEPARRDEIRRELSTASVRRVGEVMMGTAPASNIVYNAAANLTTAVLGGPEGLTARIRARYSLFADVSVRRYMLRDRQERGDNDATAFALGLLYQQLASRTLPGIDAVTHDALRAALRRADDPTLGAHFAKDGSLPSDPLAEVRAGWYERASGASIYVVMTTQPAPGPAGRDASSQRLATTATAIAAALTSAAR
jgi:hypothetical protein